MKLVSAPAPAPMPKNSQENEPQTDYRLGCSGILLSCGFILTCLKLLNLISLSWWIVLFPIYLIPIMWMIVGVIVLGFFIAAIFVTKS